MEKEQKLKTKYGSLSVIWTVSGKGGPDYLGIEATEVKLYVKGNTKRSSLSVKV
jgi:hypothetical protein